MGFGNNIMQARGFNRPFAPFQGEKVAEGRMRGFVFDQKQNKREGKAPSPWPSPPNQGRGDRTGKTKYKIGRAECGVQSSRMDRLMNAV